MLHAVLFEYFSRYMCDVTTNILLCFQLLLCDVSTVITVKFICNKNIIM